MPSNVISEVVVNGNTYGIAASDAMPNLATVEPNAASSSKAYSVGDHVVVNDVYYKVIDDISIDDAFVVNTNIEVAKVGDEIEELNTNLTANNQPFRYGYENGKYGYITREGGADTFNPFKNITKVGSYTNSSSSKTIDCTAVPNYANLTADDFLICTTSARAQSQYGGSAVLTASVNISKSYNPNTGELTLSGLRAAYYQSGTSWWTAVTITAFDVFVVA